jgi:hypothetical protein
MDQHFMIDEFVIFGGLADAVEEQHTAVHLGVHKGNLLKTGLPAENKLVVPVENFQPGADGLSEPQRRRRRLLCHGLFLIGWTVRPADSKLRYRRNNLLTPERRFRVSTKDGIFRHALGEVNKHRRDAMTRKRFSRETYGQKKLTKSRPAATILSEFV